MTDPRACKVCPFLSWEDKLSMKDVLEWERLDRYLKIHGHLPKKSVPTYMRLYQNRYWPPCDLERMGAA
jgi:hypothetical protein